MSCHGDNKGNNGAHNHSGLKHILHMALCCGLPILIIGALPLIARFSPKASVLLGAIAPFLCPLMMLAMLPMMFGGRKKGSCCSNTNENEDNKKPLELNGPAE